MIRSKGFVDAYGELLWSYYKTGEPKHEIVERDDGLIMVGKYGGKVYLSEYRHWERLDKTAMKHVKGRVLDIGCGGGRHSLYLQQKGHEVTGIDNSPLSIKVSKRRGLKKAHVLPIERTGELRPRVFDSVIMMGNNFGLFGSLNKAKSLLRRHYTLTSTDGSIVAMSRDPYTTKDPVHLAYQKRNRQRGRMSGQLRLRVRYKNLVGHWFDYLLVSQEELKQIIEDTGWGVRTFIDGEDGQYVVVLGKE